MAEDREAPGSTYSACLVWHCGLSRLPHHRICSLRITRDIWLYALCLVLFSGYKVAEVFNPGIPYLHAFLEDLVALPIVLKTAQLIIRVFIPHQRQYMIPTRDAIVIAVLFALYYEVLLPRTDARFTADVLDLVCYAAGLRAYLRWMNRPATLRPSPTPTA